MATWRMPNGTVLTGVHEQAACAGRYCTLHNPSINHMSSWPLAWRGDKAMFERTCGHGVGHPDKDHLAFVKDFRGTYAFYSDSIHGCDGCCRRPSQNIEEKR